jgi:hypothetical protein
MRRLLACAAIGAAALAAAVSGAGAPGPAAGHMIMTAAQITWGEGPPSLPKGVSMAVLAGDPAQAGPFTFRAKFPAGYRIAPHWHPTAEHVTVLEGTYAMGNGDAFDMAALHELTAGGFSVMPAEQRHFSYAKDGATIQVHGMGPFTVTYVDPKDDPRSAPAK